MQTQRDDRHRHPALHACTPGAALVRPRRPLPALTFHPSSNCCVFSFSLHAGVHVDLQTSEQSKDKLSKAMKELVSCYSAGCSRARHDDRRSEIRSRACHIRFWLTSFLFSFFFLFWFSHSCFSPALFPSERCRDECDRLFDRAFELETGCRRHLHTFQGAAAETAGQGQKRGAAEDASHHQSDENTAHTPRTHRAAATSAHALHPCRACGGLSDPALWLAVV